ncbi:MAG: DUF4199 domain-containing protein [Odoribacteraceae bacterium]|nr:DUF4199 domain-containing protein [Odoribacteraceae bacterium]
MTHHRSFSPIVIFGLLIGGSFIVASFLFIVSGREIVLNPRLNNVISCLSIIGCFMGIKKFRDERLTGAISYGRAFSTGLKIILVATVLYTLYTYFLYSAVPEFMENYKQIMTGALKKVYGETSFYALAAETLNKSLSPGLIAFGEFFRELIFGMFFLLVVAAIVKRSSPVNTHP